MVIPNAKNISDQKHGQHYSTRGFPPKAIASNGTESMPAPCTPVFAMPRRSPTQTRMVILLAERAVIKFKRY